MEYIGKLLRLLSLISLYNYLNAIDKGKIAVNRSAC
jgi:hypothetical protein